MNEEKVFYRLKKETPECKAGAVFKIGVPTRFNPERNGGADATAERQRWIERNFFHVTNTSRVKRSPNANDSRSALSYLGADVLNEPDWFEEVFPVAPEFASADELKKMSKGAKNGN